MSVESRSGVPDLICPLCKGQVVASSGCLSCHLPMRDVVRHQRTARTSRGQALARGLRVRVTGIVLYAAVVAWCAHQLPTSLPFVVPGAVLGGGVLHVWKGRPWLGLLVFAIVVVVVPALFWPSMTTGLYGDLTGGR
ncbi:hypothetical protein EKO23_09770 [Nocardioides guangzhouensis]|uniref:Uncharacterized protein n=1 Tax=Nocardioides guangzhouensis TaxID=2497878 RepID=A0A4Q4ZEZ7_9ACTN|nr:hypothetical protein [Nocardioides guangzhouensis]RYP86235.1 hypothetical protein EKO23_09770 [Nocardioides guangzhouensis]